MHLHTTFSALDLRSGDGGQGTQPDPQIAWPSSKLDLWHIHKSYQYLVKTGSKTVRQKYLRKAAEKFKIILGGFY